MPSIKIELASINLTKITMLAIINQSSIDHFICLLASEKDIWHLVWRGWLDLAFNTNNIITLQHA